MRRNSLSTKIFIYSALIIVIAMGISYSISIFFLEQHFISERKEEFPKIAKKIEYLLNVGKDFELESYIKNLKEKKDITVLIMDEKEKRWINNRGGSGGGFLIESLESKKFLIKNQRLTEAKILLYNEKIENRWVSIRTSLSILNYYKKEIGYFNLIGAFIAILISLIFGKLFSKKFVKDIEVLQNKTEEISKLNFKSNADIDREDELGLLSKNIDKMSKKLEIAINDLESFVSNTSHELKTPIAIISSKVQVLMKNQDTDSKTLDMYKTILRESYYTKELISKLLILSKLDVLKSLKKEKINLKDLIYKIIERYDYLELSKNLTVSSEIENTTIYIDKEFFQIALENIIQNSLKYCEENNEVNIQLKNGILKIENKISDNRIIDLEKIFIPFNRGENYSRIEGNGLGLTLVKKIFLLLDIKYQVSIEDEKFKFIIYLK
ncbi:HAMP domain-containing histidine kinase [Cetobacterium somerae]|uniref:sensor histidine kinase n=1 Tax=Cetobacterium sp. NK01 TaxID=2993530 RepID=UPI00211703F4|nr:HAMP domain-containing sensor histidine kinase [Cetobacterium sp. NK01]MCQ8213100.1 HAMP domain-containing histidine kinase [Cetobacterium sp. NK01]